MSDQPQLAPEEIAANIERNIRNAQNVAQNGLNAQTIAGLLPSGIMEIAASFMGDEFINEQLEENFPAIKEAIMERITDPGIPADENVFIVALGNMSGEEITDILQSSPQLQQMLMGTVVQSSNSGSLLEATGISTEGVPQPILDKPVAEITAEDLRAVDNETIQNLIVQLPVTAEDGQGFNSVLAAFNEQLDQDVPLLAGGATLEERQQAFEGAMAAVVEQNSTLENEALSAAGGAIQWIRGGLSNLFGEAAEDTPAVDQSLEERITNEAFDAIRAAIPETLQAMSAEATANFSLEDMEPAEVQALVRENTDVIHEMLVDPANRDAIGNIITLDLIRNNMDNPAISGMALELAADQSEGMIAGFIGNILESFPALQELFDMFNNLLSSFVGPMMENMGLDNDDQAPEVAAAPEAAQPPASEQEQQVAATALPGGPS